MNKPQKNKKNSFSLIIKANFSIENFEGLSTIKTLRKLDFFLLVSAKGIIFFQ